MDVPVDFIDGALFLEFKKSITINLAKTACYLAELALYGPWK